MREMGLSLSTEVKGMFGTAVRCRFSVCGNRNQGPTPHGQSGLELICQKSHHIPAFKDWQESVASKKYVVKRRDRNHRELNEALRPSLVACSRMHAEPAGKEWGGRAMRRLNARQRMIHRKLFRSNQWSIS
jgi:hypothetical protein